MHTFALFLHRTTTCCSNYKCDHLEIHFNASFNRCYSFDIRWKQSIAIQIISRKAYISCFVRASVEKAASKSQIIFTLWKRFDLLCFDNHQFCTFQISIALTMKLFFVQSHGLRETWPDAAKLANIQINIFYNFDKKKYNQDSEIYLNFQRSNRNIGQRLILD